MKKHHWLIVGGMILSFACSLLTGSEATPVPEGSPVVRTATPDSETPPTAVDTPAPSPTPEDPLGTLRLETDEVFHGREEVALEPLLGSAPFFVKDLIRVIEGGEALLDFGDQMRLRLFNDTELQMVSAEVAEDVPLGVELFLFFGGFTGDLVEEGGSTVIRTPGDAEITVLGTEYFVAYDPDAATTMVGNFGGTVGVVGTGGGLDLESGMYVVVPDGGAPGPAFPLPLSREAFDALAREENSAIQAATRVTSWSLEIRHEFSAGEEGEVSTFLRFWQGEFSVVGDRLVGSGVGEIEDTYLVCYDENDIYHFDLQGSFDFVIGGEVEFIDDETVRFKFEITALKLEMSDLSEVVGYGGNCDFFVDFFLGNNRAIVEDLPLAGADQITLDAISGAEAVYDLDGSAYSYSVGGDEYSYNQGIYFQNPIEVILQAGP